MTELEIENDQIGQQISHLRNRIASLLEDRDLILLIFQHATHQLQQFVSIINNKYSFCHIQSVSPPCISAWDKHRLLLSLPLPVAHPRASKSWNSVFT